MLAPFSLRESSDEIAGLCRAVETVLAEVPELTGLDLRVEVLENFDNLPEAATSQSTKNSPAVYRQSTRTIYVNRSTFFRLPAAAQQGVLGHEIGHAIIQRDSLMEKFVAYDRFGNAGEEFLADRLACQWGFYDGLRVERLTSYGESYVAVLDKWRDESVYLDEIVAWHTLRLAGLAAR